MFIQNQTTTFPFAGVPFTGRRFAGLTVAALVFAVEMPCALAAVEHGAEHVDVGFPQLDPSSYASQLFWLAIAFALMYLMMSKVALPGVLEVIENRAETRRRDLEHAEKANTEAADITKAYEDTLARAHATARESVAKAEQASVEKTEKALAVYLESARERVEGAEARIAKAKAEAMTSLTDISSELAAEIVGKVAPISVTKADAKKAVENIAAQTAG